MKKSAKPITFKLPEVSEDAQVTFIFTPKDLAEKMLSAFKKQKPLPPENDVATTIGLWYNKDIKRYQLIKLSFNSDKATVVEVQESSDMLSRARVQLKLALIKNKIL